MDKWIDPWLERCVRLHVVLGCRVGMSTKFIIASCFINTRDLCE